MKYVATAIDSTYVYSTSLVGPDHYFLQGAIAYNISACKKEGLVRFTGPTRS